MVEHCTSLSMPPWLPRRLELGFYAARKLVYQGLAQGRIDEDALRDLLVRSRPADWPCVFGIDASTIGRPWAVTSPMVPPIFQEILRATRQLRSCKDFVDTALSIYLSI